MAVLRTIPMTSEKMNPTPTMQRSCRVEGNREEFSYELKRHEDSNRQFVKVLGAVLDHGMQAVEAA